LHFMQGTPYIYQGEELGMTNVPFTGISDLRDLESINAWNELVEKKKQISREDMLRYLRLKSRDNSRTPMQWNSEPNAGFSPPETQTAPWIMVNPNYREINVEEQMQRSDSVYAFYKKLIQLRKEMEIITHGNYELLFPDDPYIFIYTRRYKKEELLVICNFSDFGQVFKLPERFNNAKILLTNEEDPLFENNTEKIVNLNAYGTLVLNK